MPINPFTQFVFDIFIISAIIITAYTVNFYYLAFLSKRRKEVLPTVNLGTPSVTIQLPIYNEKYVAKRLVDAVERPVVGVEFEVTHEIVQWIFSIVFNSIFSG